MNLKVLILEDNQADIFLLLQELKRSKFNIISKVVENESDYRKELKGFGPDIIISDFFLNDFNGIKALRIAKELSSEFPFIMVTSSIDEETAVQCMKNGADDFITKEHYYRIPTAIISAIDRKKDKEEKFIAIRKLNESEKQFRDLFNNMTIGLYRATPEGKIFLVNSTILKMLGFDSVKELLDYNNGKEGGDISYPKKIFKDLINDHDQLLGVESVWNKKNGEFLFVRESARAVKNDQNEILYYEGTVEDISELKRSETAYAEKDKLYKIIFDQSVNGIFLVDYLSGRIIESNNSFQNIIGYSEEEINSLTIFDILNEDSKELFNKNQKENISARYTGDKIYKRKDGSLIYVQISVSPMVYKEKQIICMVVKDITRQKEVEKELEESRYFLQHVLDTLPNILYIYNFNSHKLIYVNQKRSSFLGFRNDELLKLESMNVLYHPDDNEVTKKNFLNLGTSASNEVFDHECRLRDAYGGFLWFRMHETVFFRNKDGSPKEILGIAINITEKKVLLEEFKKAKEKAEEASQAKSDFLANMSHEIRTPLNGIIGLSQLLSGTELNAKQKEYLDLIKTSSNSLISIINDILDFAKIESGTIKLNRDIVDIKNIVTETTKIFDIDARKKGINFFSEVDGGIKYNLVTDHTRLKQILFNLLSNAFKFTEAGYVKLVVKEISRFSNNAILSISVSDTGIGIPENKMGVLFERFTQLDGSYNKKYPGSGLGLTIVKNLLDLFNGKIYVDSKVDSGTTFSCEIPFLINAELAGNVDIVIPPKFETDGKPRDILLADDDFINQLYIKTILKERNFNVTVAGNGKEALKLLSEKLFDLVLMDGQMPEMDGFETTKRIRDIENKTGVHVPIVALTAYALHEERNKCFEAGMDGYVSKPIDEFLLLTTIDSFLKK